MRKEKSILIWLAKFFGIALQHDIEYTSEHLKSMLADRLQMPNLLNLFKVPFVDKFRLWLFERHIEVVLSAPEAASGPISLLQILFFHIVPFYVLLCICLT